MAVVAHALNPITQEVEADGSFEFKASLVYRESSRTSRATQRNSVSKTKPNQNKKQKNNRQK